ncbi:hypothetical protein RclHR1_00330018 [Rhizophagus clarus]|uniref:BTB domain-containing protein n=1 Tax=Rhizophagus clarus TaxID=94130 RepID=A0A2Z6RQ51_9GLOM|nr:hypothetical protein RclHR1_00330018 [Rhizophagus clarus]GES81736.1 hypothetical protein GLOIN_2v1778254 [Rhizophagus clarus]
MTSKFYSNISKALAIMLNDSDDYNVIIQVGENPNMKEFRAHSNILKARSPYFKGAFSDGWIDKKDNVIEFKKPNIDPDVFEIILKYIYTGEVNLDEQSGENIIKLLIASDELLLEELFEHVQDHLIEKQTSWVKRHYVFILHTIYKLSSCKKLHEHCLESICANPRPLITSKDFITLDEDILYDLLKRDDLKIEEIDAWENLIKWGMQHTPGLGNKNNNKTKWTTRNFEALKKTLSKLIPLIRFSEISSSDFYDKVRPFKTIIPNNIYEELVGFLMKNTLPKKSVILPPRIRIQIESKIIKQRQAFIITNWIEKKDANASRKKEETTYKYILIYRGSRDGIDNQSFEDQCIMDEPTLVLIKCQNSNKIYGGYTPVGFYEEYGEEFIYSKDSFIFSFEENEGTQNMELSRVKSYDHAIFNVYNNDYGFNFGDHDLYMQDENLYIGYSGYYEDNLSGNDYEIEEIEAYRIE